MAYLFHLAEEWFGGFLDWTPAALGLQMTATRFILINSIGCLAFSIGAVVAVRQPRYAWLGTSIAALFGLNGVLHALGSLGPAGYSPGVITGVLLYVPLSAAVLSRARRQLSSTTFAASILFGIGLHMLVPIAAFL